MNLIDNNSNFVNWQNFPRLFFPEYIALFLMFANVSSFGMIYTSAYMVIKSFSSGRIWGVGGGAPEQKDILVDQYSR